MSYQEYSTIEFRQKTYQRTSYISGWISVRTLDIKIWIAKKEVLVKMVKKLVISIFLKNCFRDCLETLPYKYF